MSSSSIASKRSPGSIETSKTVQLVETTIAGMRPPNPTEVWSPVLLLLLLLLVPARLVVVWRKDWRSTG